MSVGGAFGIPEPQTSFGLHYKQLSEVVIIDSLSSGWLLVVMTLFVDVPSSCPEIEMRREFWYLEFSEQMNVEISGVVNSEATSVYILYFLYPMCLLPIRWMVCLQRYDL